MSNFTVGSAVEVGSDEPGFHGAWYTAAIVDEANNTNKSSGKKSKTRKKTGFIVKYDTLIQDDDNVNEPLTEVVHLSLVRPLPPTNVRRNDGKTATAAEVVLEDDGGGGGEFEVYDVVDAYHRDGWWVGVVKEVVLEGEMKKYVVMFENPPEEFEFDKNGLRFHVDWVDSCWMTPPKKVCLSREGCKRAEPSLSLNGLYLRFGLIPGEESGDANGDSSFTTPAKETLIADTPVSAKYNSLCKQPETNSDVVVTYSRSKRNGNSVENGSRRKRFKSLAGGKGNTKAIVSVLETSGSDDISEDSLTQTHETGDGKSRQNRKSRRLSKLSANKAIGLLNDTDATINLDEVAPLSVWFQGKQPLSVLKKSSCLRTPGNSPAQAMVVTESGGSRTRTTADYQKDWPFIKRAPIWDTLESLELYQTPPQKPHFSPLKKMKEEIREGTAIGHMVTFGGIVQRLSGLQLSDSVDIINSSLETLCELETHGFDVGSVRARLAELALLKSKAGPCEIKRKEVESELEKSRNEKYRAEKELDQLQVEMQVLKEKTEQAISVQKAKEEEIVRLKTNLDIASNQIIEWEVAFKKLCKKDLV
ncbi:DUF724 domain-containing protein 6-like [Bidens hawaiensis]|uniref:DUF724 domain-containing protein 6-like n=1 Tax=Bidens hawaiensis TaxID=980011 RepID=UPI00404B2A36